MGLTGTQETSRTIETPHLIWHLHTAEVDLPDLETLSVDRAMADSDSGLYVVMSIVWAEEHEELHTTIFVPAIEALVPTEISRGEATARIATQEVQVTPIDTQFVPATGWSWSTCPPGSLRWDIRERSGFGMVTYAAANSARRSIPMRHPNTA